MVCKLNSRTLICACFGSLLLGVVVGQVSSSLVSAQLAPANVGPNNAVNNAAFAKLGANLYLQTSAEFRACCEGIYKLAVFRLEILRAKNPEAVRPAIVMDLDETVLDNSAFQSELLLRNVTDATERERIWDDYQDRHAHDARLIPGVAAFLERAEAWSVTPVFISNRSVKNFDATVAALARNGIQLRQPQKQLFLKPDDASGDKSARREYVATQYNVLMYFGDNLRDFSDAFRANLPKNPTLDDYRQAIARRAELAEQARHHWGVDWFVIPNPIYGEWETLWGPDPKALLRTMTREELESNGQGKTPPVSPK